MAMKRNQMPPLSTAGQQAFSQYERHLASEEDVRPASLRNYLSDLRQFIAWCEAGWAQGQEQTETLTFSPNNITTPLLTRYRTYLQIELGLKPASVNRYLISLKKYCGWATEQTLLLRNPAKVVKLVDQQAHSPRQLSDEEEEALIGAVEKSGGPRDRTILTLMLHTGLRAGEVCQLKVQDLVSGKHSGSLRVLGKGNKYREVPLNVTARKVLGDYRKHLPADASYLFCSTKTGEALTERGLGHLMKKYTRLAGLTNISPHDLRHRFGYRMAEKVPLHRLAQLMGHDSLDTTLLYIRATPKDLQKEVEKIAWQ